MATGRIFAIRNGRLHLGIICTVSASPLPLSHPITLRCSISVPHFSPLPLLSLPDPEQCRGEAAWLHVSTPTTTHRERLRRIEACGSGSRRQEELHMEDLVPGSMRAIESAVLPVLASAVEPLRQRMRRSVSSSSDLPQQAKTEARRARGRGGRMWILPSTLLVPSTTYAAAS